MCGIAGRFAHAGLGADPGWRQRASRLLHHRGPDGEGEHADDRCELVHRRLALIDLSPTGHQPMANEDGSVLVIYNGELYNHRELRDRLRARGHVFRGTSDTEVIVHAWEEYGLDMCGLLRGMFAFAVYDRAKQSLLLVRDRFGIKPLFYARIGDELVFASELKAIAARDGFTPTLDRQACYDYLGLSYVPEPATGFANIHALEKGTAMLVDARGTHVTRYATVHAAANDRLSFDDSVGKLEQLLLDAAARQSIADVPVAALLSGGIDSSLVVAALSRATNATAITFNVRFPDRSFDETHVARAVAEHYKTDHRTIDVPATTLRADTVLDLLAHFDQPFSDESLIPTYQVCQAIRDAGIICTLSGDGGDEAFGGYPTFWNLHLIARLMRLPGLVDRALATAGDTLAPYTRDIGRQVGRVARLAAAGRRDTAELFEELSSYLPARQKHALVRPEARAGLADVTPSAPRYERATADLDELTARLTDYYFAQSLPSHMLRKVDMMSMRASLEVRVPMLDEDVVGLGLSLGRAAKTDGRRGKLALRALAEKWLPEVVARHPKHGFAMPLDRMVDRTFHELLRDTLLGSSSRLRGVMELGVVEQWIGLFERAHTGELPGTISREGLYQRMLSLLSLERWLERFHLTW